MPKDISFGISKDIVLIEISIVGIVIVFIYQRFVTDNNS